MWRWVCLVIVGCNVSVDPCESVEGYSATYDAGYTDGATCAGYNNPFDSKEDPEPPDTDVWADDDSDLSADSDSCLWSAYDQGFSAGRSGADCSAGFD